MSTSRQSMQAFTSHLWETLLTVVAALLSFLGANLWSDVRTLKKEKANKQDMERVQDEIKGELRTQRMDIKEHHREIYAVMRDIGSRLSHIEGMMAEHLNHNHSEQPPS